MDNQELSVKPRKNYKPILYGILALIILIAVIFLITRKKGPTNYVTSSNQPSGQGQNNNPVATSSAETNFESIPGNEIVRTVVSGTNQVRIDNVVVTEKGAPTNNAVAPMSDNAPKQSDFLAKENIPAQILQISVGNNQFSPKEFTTTKFAPTTFSLTSTDNEAHYITFDDSSLSAVLIFVGPQQTKAITFNAPAKAGEYTFRCGLPGHADKGEVGKMIVK